MVPSSFVLHKFGLTGIVVTDNAMESVDTQRQLRTLLRSIEVLSLYNQ